MAHDAIFAVLLLAPLVGFVINGINWKGQNYLVAGTIATLAAATSFLCSVILVKDVIALPAEARQLTANFFDWITVGDFKAEAKFVVDQISAIMVLVVTGVGSLIHLFSVGYMSHDERPSKFFAYLNLFLFNMLLLILGGNLLVMFVGWEGVGLCSYLLIGFWFSDEEKAAAGMKAFITNRIGDAGLVLGIFLLFVTFGTIDFATLTSRVSGIESGFGPITLACIFLFIGAMGKSAQIPLYVWLPDAMAGPTPVSALIHAATMVTAGVYMVCRLSALYVAAPYAMQLVAITGAATAILGATIGLAQWDIKKVLAYSTVSQLGYMFLGAGVGAFGAAMFHLMTHAFFKALMFLGAGSVIHGMHHEQDIRKMGGLKKYMPITHATFFLGWLAIIGIPPFAGFFSKDEILWQAFHSPRGHFGYWLVGAVGAACTAFYMTRLMALTFWGKSRVSKDVHPHESPLVMTLPLIVLAVLSVIGGWIGIPHVISHTFHVDIPNVLEHWLEPRLSAVPGQVAGSAVLEWALMGVSVSIAAIAALMAHRFYIVQPEMPEKVVSKIRGLHRAVYNKYWVDEAYFAAIINPIVRGSEALWNYVDVRIIDRTTYVVSDLVKDVGRSIQALQSGNMQQYALYMVLGLAAVLLLL